MTSALTRGQRAAPQLLSWVNGAIALTLLLSGCGYDNRSVSTAQHITSGKIVRTAVTPSIRGASRAHIATDGSAGLLIHVVSPISGEKILPDTDPLPGGTSDTVDIAACRGEYEAASFVIHSLEDQSLQLTLGQSDLTDPGTGATIDASEVDIRFVKPWNQGLSAWNDIGKTAPDDFRQVLVPELLLKDDSLVLVEGERNYVKIDHDGSQSYVWVNPKVLAPTEQVLPSLDEFPVRDAAVLQPALLGSHANKQVWVTLHVPADALPGEYQGRIDIQADGHSVATLPIRVQVYGFALAEPHITYAMYYRGQLDPKRASIGSEYKTVEQMRNELLDLQRHGIRYPTMYQPAANLDLVKLELSLREEIGINRGALYYLGIQTTASSLGELSTAAEPNLRRILPQFAKLARGAGYDEVDVYGRDEAKGPDLVEQIRLWKIVHELGERVFVAGSTGAHELVGDSLDTQVSYGNPDYKEAEQWHGTGQKIFSYANPQTGPENPYLFRLNYGLILWADYDGAMPYAYQHCFGACWNDIDHPVYRDHNLTYPTVDGVIPTLAWEGLREGIDDVRYLTTLDDALATAQPSNAPQIIAAQLFLSQLKEQVRSERGNHGKYNERMILDLGLMRRQVAAHLAAVSGE